MSHFAPPPDTFDNVGGHFQLLQLGGAAGTYWVEARVSAKHPAVHKGASYNKDFFQPILSLVPKLRSSGLKVTLFSLVFGYMQTH